MLKIGITGGIGSGKSFVCDELVKRNIKIYDCDKAAKRLIVTSPSIRTKLEMTIGQNAFVNGQLNKPIVRSFLLASEEHARMIDNIIHPEVAKDFTTSGYSWMECAILFESGFDRLVDKKILVSAPLDLRISRVMNRDSISRQTVEGWMKRQWTEEQIRAYCDYEIINDGNEDIGSQIDKILNDINNLLNQNK